MNKKSMDMYSEVLIRPNHNVVVGGWLIQHKSKEHGTFYATIDGSWVTDANLTGNRRRCLHRSATAAKEMIDNLHFKRNIYCDAYLEINGERHRFTYEAAKNCRTWEPILRDDPTLRTRCLACHTWSHGRETFCPRCTKEIADADARRSKEQEDENPTEEQSGGFIEIPDENPPTYDLKTGERVQVAQIGNDPKGEAGSKKTPMQFIPLNALGQISHAMKLGAAKYGPNNWLTSEGVGILTYKGAVMRHLSAIDRGEDIDPESGQSHWAHIAASCMIILDAMANDQLIDDRVLCRVKGRDPEPESEPHKPKFKVGEVVKVVARANSHYDKVGCVHRVEPHGEIPHKYHYLVMLEESTQLFTEGALEHFTYSKI